MTKQLNLECPSYVFGDSLKLETVGDCIDKALLADFAGKSVVIRGIQSGKHDLDKEGLVASILESGTDRNDRESINEVKVSDEEIGLFGLACRIQETPFVLPILEGFHRWKPKSLERPQLKVDIWMIYDATMLENVEYTHSKYNVKAKDGYRFKDSANKGQALLGLAVIN